MKVRASAIGKVMTNARKKGELSKTCLTYVQQTLKEELYEVKSVFSNKYTDKGIVMEDEAIELVGRLYDLGLVFKNEEHYENDYITGTPDLLTEEAVRDIKCSWDVSTFPLFETEVPNKDYYWQLQGYMWLTGKQVAYLDYCLMDTPITLINKEARSMAFRSGIEEVDESEYEALTHNLTFSRHPDAVRVKTFKVERDEEAIEAIKTRVEEVNAYVDNLKATVYPAIEERITI
jgi:hypothetical protein